MYSQALDQKANGSSFQGERDNVRKRSSCSLHLLEAHMRTKAKAAQTGWVINAFHTGRVERDMATLKHS
jgi:hypothetical protein